MKRKWKPVLFVLFIVIFASGFFFLDSEQVLYNQEQVEEEEISAGQKRNIMSHIEIAKFKFHNLTVGEHYPNPQDMTKKELEDYLSDYFSDPMLGDLVDYWSGKNDELGPLVDQFISLSSDIKDAEYVYLEEKVILVQWTDQKFNIDIDLTVKRHGNGWIIKDIQFNG